MRIHWLRLAARNLREQAESITRDNGPAAGKRHVTMVYEAVDRLARRPGLGRPGRILGTRELVISATRLVIPYRVREDRVEILRVFHGAQRRPEASQGNGSNGRGR